MLRDPYAAISLKKSGKSKIVVNIRKALQNPHFLKLVGHANGDLVAGDRQDWRLPFGQPWNSQAKRAELRIAPKFKRNDSL